MTVWDDMDYEVRPLPLDGVTADRLLAGRVAPEDAPPGYSPVVRLLDAVSAEATAVELEHESEGVLAFALALRSSQPTASVSRTRFSMPSSLTRARLLAAALAAALATTAGLASAGSLPGAAQDVASLILDKLGVSVPGPNDPPGTHSDDRGRSGIARSASSTAAELARKAQATGVKKGAGISTAGNKRKGQAGQHGSGGTSSEVRGKSGTAPNAAADNEGETSEVARTSAAAGVEEGAVISTAATKGKGQAGQHGSGGTTSDVRGKSGTAPKAAAGQAHRNGSEQGKESGRQQGSPPAAGAGSAPVTRPDGQGTGTPDPGGHSSQNTSTANNASDGGSSAGSSNGSSGQPRRP